MQYCIHVWHGDKTTVPWLDHRTNSISEAKYAFHHWIAEYFRTSEDYTRYILVTDDLGMAHAVCIIHPGGQHNWRCEFWDA